MRQRQRAEVLRRLGFQADAGQVTAQSFSDAVHRFLGRTESVLALTQLDDLLDEHDPVNVPATSTEHPNWRRRYSEPLESLADHHPAWRLLEILAGERSAGGKARSAQNIS
jgi:4-alpha-glucanotransferase